MTAADRQFAKRFFGSEKNKLPCDDDGNEIVDPAAEREEEQEEG